MNLRFWRQRTSRALGRSTEERLAALQVRERETDIELRQLKLAAVRRAVTEAADPIEALEVVTIATHTGTKPIPALPRRHREEDPMAALGRKYLEQRVSESPSALLREELEQRRLVQEAADELEGGGRRASSDTGMLTLLIEHAAKPLAQAIGAGLGLTLQQHAAAAATAPLVVTEQPGDAVLPPGASDAPAMPASVMPASGMSTTPAASPGSIRASMAIIQLKRKTPDRGAQWILTQAEATPELGEVVDQLLACESDEVLPFLDDLLPIIAGDPARSEWLPVLRHLREREDWTLACHAALCAQVEEASRSEMPAST